MVADDFQPKLGRVRSKSGLKNERYLNRIVRDISRATQPTTNRSRSSFSGSRSGRGYSAAAQQQVRSFQPGRRRVVIKARFTRFRNGDLGAARAHLRYIQRDGVTREGEPGDLYGADTDRADGKVFVEQASADRHQFRFIIAPEDGAQMEDLKPFIRDLMRQAETDLGTKLDWVAVDHFNTGHPHTHIVVRGKCLSPGLAKGQNPGNDRGQDLVIARDYLSHGFRERARDLVTLELGPETRHELDQKIAREVQSERFTQIDRSLLRDADQGILTHSSSPKLDQQWRSHRIGRLRKLESMGLAEELKPGVWKIADRSQSVLRQLGRRGEIMKTMQRVLKETGIDRGASDYTIFDASQTNMKITGKVVAMGLSNELQDHHYVVVDGTDGKLYYAEIGRLSKYDPPGKDMVVTIRGFDPSKQQYQSRQVTARLFIESHVPFRDLASADGATWLDRKILAKNQEIYRDKGFGAQANRAIRMRQQWLIKEELMTERNGQLVARRKLLETLQRREISRVARQLQKELGLNYRVAATGERQNGQVQKFVRLTSGRFAVVLKGKEFSLVPWREVMRVRKGRGLGIEVGKGILR